MTKEEILDERVRKYEARIATLAKELAEQFEDISWVVRDIVDLNGKYYAPNGAITSLDEILELQRNANNIHDKFVS